MNTTGQTTPQAVRPPLHFGRHVEAALIYAVLAILVVQTLYPLLWVLFGSLKTQPEMMNNIWGAPRALEFGNYAEAWRIAGMGQRILNSVHVTALSLVILILVATPCAYAVARLRFRGKGLVLAVIVGAMLVPPQVLAIPLFVVSREVGVINSLTGISLVYATAMLPLSVFILRSFFLTLPSELEDAARVDGAGRLAILVRVMLPLARPGIALVTIFAFIEIWNDFFLAFLLLRREEVQTIPLGLVNFFQQYDSLWNLYFAALMMTTLPVIVVFVLMQRQFIAGITAGATKG